MNTTGDMKEMTAAGGSGLGRVQSRRGPAAGNVPEVAE
jgi:hypothetical protein